MKITKFFKRIKISKNLKEAFELLCKLPKDFFAEGRKDISPQERDSF